MESWCSAFYICLSTSASILASCIAVLASPHLTRSSKYSQIRGETYYTTEAVDAHDTADRDTDGSPLGSCRACRISLRPRRHESQVSRHYSPGVHLSTEWGIRPCSTWKQHRPNQLHLGRDTARSKLFTSCARRSRFTFYAIYRRVSFH